MAKAKWPLLPRLDCHFAVCPVLTYLGVRKWQGDFARGKEIALFCTSKHSSLVNTLGIVVALGLELGHALLTAKQYEEKHKFYPFAYEQDLNCKTFIGFRAGSI